MPLPVTPPDRLEAGRQMTEAFARQRLARTSPAGAAADTYGYPIS